MIKRLCWLYLLCSYPLNWLFLKYYLLPAHPGGLNDAAVYLLLSPLALPAELFGAAGGLLWHFCRYLLQR